MWERRMAGWLGRRVLLGDRHGGPWPAPPGHAVEEVVFEGNTGARLTGRYFSTAAARGVVVCVHPDRRYAGHWFVRSGWVDLLVGHGLDVLIFDLTGYGGSQGPATYFAEDVHAAVRFASRWSGGLPVSLLGVSMGAHAAASASPWLHEVEGIVLESPPLGFAPMVGPVAGRVLNQLFKLSFPRTYRQTQAIDRIAHAAPRRILVAATTADEVVPVAQTRAIAQAAPAERTRYIEFEEAAHLHLIDVPRYRQQVLQTLGAAPSLRTDSAPAEALPRLRGDRSPVRGP